MERTEINPWEWSKAIGFSQAVKVSGASELLICSGQTVIGDDGTAPLDADMGVQVRTAFANLGMVLTGGGMGPADVVRINCYASVNSPAPPCTRK
jgi:enamine deaminase RidA (YjgF/YER057c/UK114 family)